VIDCNEWRTEKSHEHEIWGKKNDSNYDGNCTAHHCLSWTYEISHRWIFVRSSVQADQLIQLSGIVMEESVLLLAVAQLWKGVYCCRQWHSYGRECTVAGSGTVIEVNVLLQAVAQLSKLMYCCRQWHSYGS